VYDVFMSDNENKRPKGRPPLSPEEREQRRIERNKRSNARHKETGYAASKKYNEANKDAVLDGARKRSKKMRDKYSDLGILILREKRDALEQVLKETGLSITDLFIGAVEEKYSIVLR